MLLKLKIENFKRFDNVEIELGDAVVFIGPNNSGKTTALQALTLWDVGWRKWLSKRKNGSKAQERRGVAINRRDLFAVPTPSGRLLWRDLGVRNVTKTNGVQSTQNVHIKIAVEGLTNGVLWECGLEFDYANEESLYVRPVKFVGGEKQEQLSIPPEAELIKVAFLPPMSGLASEEFVKQSGEISVLIGQGQTAQILRNLCYRVCYPISSENEVSENWMKVASHIEKLFGSKLLPPVLHPERGEIRMQFNEGSRGVTALDLSASGRGLQQTLLLLAYVYANPGTILLLDEPDAHLEVLRQRQIFKLIRSVANEVNTQIIVASHSEVILQEAAETSKVIAFTGKPHTLTGQPGQVAKSLSTIGWDQYYQAETAGWALYLEDATDLAILQAFAKKLSHSAQTALEKPFVHYLSTNIPTKARDHFYGIRDAKKDFVGIALFDRLDKELDSKQALFETMWRRREIENYFSSESVLMRWVSKDASTDLFSFADNDQAISAMRTAIRRVTELLEIDEKAPWSNDVKATDEVLDRIFRLFFTELKLPIAFRKANYCQLVEFMKPEEIDPEVTEKLNLIMQVANSAQPRTD